MQGYWLARLFAEYQALPWLKVMGLVAYVGDTTEDGNTWGTATDATKTSGQQDDDDVGWEFDLGAEIQIYKNLKYNIAFGYLFAGDALDVNDGTANSSIDDPWARAVGPDHFGNRSFLQELEHVGFVAARYP